MIWNGPRCSVKHDHYFQLKRAPMFCWRGPQCSFEQWLCWSSLNKEIVLLELPSSRFSDFIFQETRSISVQVFVTIVLILQKLFDSIAASSSFCIFFHHVFNALHVFTSDANTNSAADIARETSRFDTNKGMPFLMPILICCLYLSLNSF